LSITAKFRVNRDRILIEVPEKNISQDKPNVVFFDAQTKQILGIGVPEETIRNDFLKQGKEFSNNLKFGVSFQCDADEDSASRDLSVTEYYIADVYLARQAIPVALDSINYDFQIEDYEKWNEQRKLNFEYMLQARLKALTLKINGISKEIPIQKRRVEKIARLFLKEMLLPLGFSGAILFLLKKSTPILNIFLEFIGLLAVFFIGYMTWALMANVLLPKSYLSFINPEFVSSWEQKLAEYLLNFYQQK